MKFPSLRLRPHVGWVAGEIFLVLALTGLVIWLSSAIQEKRRQITGLQAYVDQQLESAGETAALKTVVDERQADLAAIMSHVPTEEGIGDVVAALEREAARLGLTLQIPVVEEAAAEAEAGGEESTPGNLKDVRLNVSVTGPPRQTLQFLHTVEHLPYLLSVGAWKFSADETQVVPGVRVSAPSSVPVEGPSAVLLAQTTSAAELTLDVYLTIHTTGEP